MKLVVIESPYAGNVVRNVRYARACMLHSLRKGEAPYASHLLYTQVLNDLEPEHRRQGIYAGFAWGNMADLVAVYCDLDFSKGMILGVEQAKARGTPIEYRYLGQDWDK